MRGLLSPFSLPRLVRFDGPGRSQRPLARRLARSGLRAFALVLFVWVRGRRASMVIGDALVLASMLVMTLCGLERGVASSLACNSTRKGESGRRFGVVRRSAKYRERPLVPLETSSHRSMCQVGFGASSSRSERPLAENRG